MNKSYENKTVFQEVKEALAGLLIALCISLVVLFIAYLIYDSINQKRQKVKEFSAGKEIEWEIILIKADDDFFTYQIQPSQEIYTSIKDLTKMLAQYGEVMENFTEKGKPVFIIRCINYRKTVLVKY
ncbi:MAG: hypothetical protein Q8Q23_04085 [bacterium]|nr:hypothetical protein [bacterium]